MYHGILFREKGGIIMEPESAAELRKRVAILERSTGPQIIQNIGQCLTGNTLKQLAVSILERNKIGVTYFRSKCDELFRQEGIRNNRRRSSLIYNYIDMLKTKPNITWPKFIHLLMYLDFKLLKVTIEIEVDGEAQTHVVESDE